MPSANRIFLAHASEDKQQVRGLYDSLKEHGLDPWLDDVDLVPGEVWTVAIPKAIASAGIFLACLSKQSVDKIGYVQNEFRRALTAFGERPPGSIFLIPVRLDDCEVPDLRITELGLSLREIQRVDLFEEDGLDRLVSAIKQAFASAPSVDGLTRPLQTENATQKPQDLANAAVEDNPARMGGEELEYSGMTRSRRLLVITLITAMPAIILVILWSLGTFDQTSSHTDVSDMTIDEWFRQLQNPEN